MSEDPIRNKPDKKVVIVCDVSVGKSCLIARYIDQVFFPTKMTIGTSFFVKQWNNENIALWDTAGQEQYNGLRGFYCRGQEQYDGLRGFYSRGPVKNSTTVSEDFTVAVKNSTTDCEDFTVAVQTR